MQSAYQGEQDIEYSSQGPGPTTLTTTKSIILTQNLHYNVNGRSLHEDAITQTEKKPDQQNTHQYSSPVRASFGACPTALVGLRTGSVMKPSDSNY